MPKRADEALFVHMKKALITMMKLLFPTMPHNSPLATMMQLLFTRRNPFFITLYHKAFHDETTCHDLTMMQPLGTTFTITTPLSTTFTHDETTKYPDEIPVGLCIFGGWMSRSSCGGAGPEKKGEGFRGWEGRVRGQRPCRGRTGEPAQ